MKRTIEQQKEWKQTAANINKMNPEDRMRLGKHIIAKYGKKMMPTTKDRVEELAAGYQIDWVVPMNLEQIGVGL